MLGKFFKPKWQHADASVRVKSLASLAGDSMELIKIAQSDPDSDVRMEAITRLHHIPTLVQMGHTAGSIGERARQRVIGLAATDHRHDHLLTEVFAWLQNPALLRSIARDSMRGVKLRHQAIAKLDDQELLFSIASNDTSKEIQYSAAAQIHDLAQLQALEKLHGKNNKRLRQLLKEREDIVQHQHKQQADIDALCAEAETLGNTQRWAQEKTRVKVLEQRWQKISKTANQTQQQRFQQALTDFQQRLQTWETEHTQQQQLQAQQAAEQARLAAEAQQQAEAAAQAQQERLEQEQQREAAARKNRQQQQAQSGSRRFLTPSPHTTLRAASAQGGSSAVGITALDPLILERH
ncbi:hypothetical protein [Thiothrix subterranea]|uniref:hypothetical protein n=1 Tax=Thiothrix subterranea TaxID=2735563 RepID=UPI00280B3B7C|nr:hypothetical protein [Thiothrix subterranea]